MRLEFAPGKIIETFGYNGSVPGPVLRLREGRQVSIDIRNDTDVDDIVHWHGLYVPSEADGAMEEGSPMVGRGGTQRYTFTAKPTGTRWYHSQYGRDDLTRSLYSGMYGFLIIEPASDPGRYDQEVLLAAHHWQGSWVSMQDIRTGPPPDNGLEVMYASASFNDKMLGHSEPVRVREGQRVLFRLLNASPTENVTLALPGHRFSVIALDGNPVALTGFRETNYDDTRAKLKVEDSRLQSLINGKGYGIGELELVPLQTLRDRVKSAGTPPGRLKVSVVRGEVRKMHRSPETPARFSRLRPSSTCWRWSSPR